MSSLHNTEALHVTNPFVYLLSNRIPTAISFENGSMGPKTKKQKSILCFSFQRPSPETQEELIDLTHEIAPVIACPVCSISMNEWDLDTRIRHVEDCLSVIAIKEETFDETTKKDGTRVEKARKLLQIDVKSELSEAIVQSCIKSEEVTESRKRKRKPELVGTQKEISKYINSKSVTKKTRVKREPDSNQQENGCHDLAPQELLPSSRKTPIPSLKVLGFRMAEGVEYQIAVDAFCYKPHELITQYFLSHFHSDHYGGITKRWCSERTIDSKIIYCSPITSKLLSLRFKVDPVFIYEIETNTRHQVYSYGSKIEGGGCESDGRSPGLYVTSIDANHCPGAVIFLFESIAVNEESTFTLHCGDFRINKAMINHPALQPFHSGRSQSLDKVYLDTTYMTPKYNFPKQELVCSAVADMFEKLLKQDELFNTWFGSSLQTRITDFLSLATKNKKKKFLVLVGTYLIGKERLAIAILKGLGQCPIYISNINSRGDKAEIIRAFDDPYLNQVVTNEDIGNESNDVMVHLVPMKIVGTAQELSNYFNHNQYFRHFERCVGLRPTGWSFEDSGNEKIINAEDEIPAVDDVSLLSTLNVLRSHPEYSYMDILRQCRPKADRKLDKSTFKIYLLPYSEHLSFRELSFFVVFLNINKVIPTVNTENAWSASRMEEIIQKWELVRKIKATRKTTLPDGLVNMIYDLSLDDF